MSTYTPGVESLLEPLRPYLIDPEISELMINQPKILWIEKSGQLLAIPLEILSELYLHRLFQLIANQNKQTLSPNHPLLSGNLPDGSRVQLCIPPASAHFTLAIRRKVIKNISLDHYQAQNFYQQSHPAFNISSDNLSLKDLNFLNPSDQNLLKLFQTKNFNLFIQEAILAKKNMVISGGTSSGKTTYLNACLKQIPQSDRLLILEDTQEIDSPHPNQVRLLSSQNISMQTLLQASLRLRPDRIIMGEIRGKEILDFIGACSTGHEGSLTTIHANNPQIAFLRMTQMYKLNPVPSMSDQDILRELQSVIDIVIQINKTPLGRLAQGVYFKWARGD